MASILLGLYEKSMPNELTLTEKLVAARTAGFDYLELSIDESDEKLARLDWNHEDRWQLTNAINDTGIPINSICLSGHRRFPLGHPDPAVQQKGLSIMQKAIVLAANIGVRIIQIAGYDVYYEASNEQTKASFANNLRLCVQMAACYGVILAFETMETSFMNTVGKAMDWVQQMQSPYLQLYPDIGNLTNAAQSYGTSVLDDLKRGRCHFTAVHLKETKPDVFREVPYGAGHVNFASAISVFLQFGVRMFVGEFWHLGEEDWPDVLTHNHTFLRSAIEEGKRRMGKM